ATAAMTASAAATASHSAGQTKTALSGGPSGLLRAAAKQVANPLTAFAIIAFALTIVAGELGFQINHHELELAVTIPDISTPQAWSHAHLVLNHIPTAGFVFALAFFVAALV